MKKIVKQIKQYWVGFIILLLFVLFSIAIFAGARIANGLSSVDTLTNKCLEKSKYSYRVGAICSDGWRSSATGRGSCSHHGGVSRWLYEYEFKKSFDECKQWAKQQSWIN